MAHSSQRFLLSHAIMIIFYGILLAVSILIQDVEFGVYGDIAHHETSQWNDKVIETISTTENGVCPTGYEKLSSFYLGLHSICKKDNSTYILDVCHKQFGYKTQYGLAQQEIDIFDDATICYKRSSYLDFHKIMESMVEYQENQGCN